MFLPESKSSPENEMMEGNLIPDGGTAMGQTAYHELTAKRFLLQLGHPHRVEVNNRSGRVIVLHLLREVVNKDNHRFSAITDPASISVSNQTQSAHAFYTYFDIVKTLFWPNSFATENQKTRHRTPTSPS